MRKKTMSKARQVLPASLSKAPTGITGFDQITGGGLPAGRPTLLCGGAGCGKTLFSMEFLVRGAVQFNEPGVFLAFEENVEELTKNVASLGFDLTDLIEKKKLMVDHVFIERSEFAETGDYDLEGLFIRLGHAIRSIGAKRVVLDTIEVLFSGLANASILRAELRRLFRWLKDQGVTAIITGEQGEETLTRHGLEEYVADCVIMLDHRVADQRATRRLRIVKYRGALHGTNEYPFLIDASGISVLPVTAVGLNHKATTGRVSSGVPRLDTMLGGKGYYRGSSILVSGTAGTGKTSLAVHLVNAACARGERCLYIASEESADQVMRNGRSIGINLQPWVKKGLLRFHVARPTYTGLEMHLLTVHKQMEEFRPAIAVIDPISSLTNIGTVDEIKNMLLRMIDMLKNNDITTLCTSLTHGDGDLEQTQVAVTSLVDTWLLVRQIEYNGERTRVLYVLKSRGMSHSNQIREFLITDRGIDLNDVYVGRGLVLTGTARKVQEMKEALDAEERQEELQRAQRLLEKKRLIMEAKINEIRSDFSTAEDEVLAMLKDQERQNQILAADRRVIADIRQADPSKESRAPKKQPKSDLKDTYDDEK